MGQNGIPWHTSGISGIPWDFLGSGSRGETSGSRGCHPTAAPEWFTDTRLMQAFIMYTDEQHTDRSQDEIPKMNDQKKAIIRAVIERAIKDGCLCSVNVGEDCLIEDSRDPDAILAVMGNNEEEWLYLRNNIGRNGVGGATLIYGKDEEVIDDYCWYNEQEERVKAIFSGEQA